MQICKHSADVTQMTENLFITNGATKHSKVSQRTGKYYSKEKKYVIRSQSIFFHFPTLMINFQTHLHLAFSWLLQIILINKRTSKVFSLPLLYFCLWQPHILHLSFGCNHWTHRGMAVANGLVISEMGKQDEVPHSMKLLKNNLFWLSVSDEVIQKCFIYDTNMRQERRVFIVRERELTPSQLSEWTVCVSPDKPIKLSLWYITTTITTTNKPNKKLIWTHKLHHLFRPFC